MRIRSAARGWFVLGVLGVVLPAGAQAMESAPAPTATVAPTSIRAATSLSGPYAALIVRHAERHGVPAALADAVVRVESRHNPRARNGVNVGLTQISIATARRMGYSGSAEGLFDPDTNLSYGIRYLGQAYRLASGDTCLTILKYQAGHGARRMTPAAGRYCAKVRTQIAANR